MGGETAHEAFLRYERKSRRRADILHYYHTDSELFPTRWQSDLLKESGKRRILFITWDPTRHESWSDVARGAIDNRIDRLARHLGNTLPKRQFWLAIKHEPEDEVRTGRDSGYQARDYRAMFRHVVERLKEGGVHNAVYVAQFMGAQVHMTRPWFNRLWPGNRYVDWLAFDLYATEKHGGQRGGFLEMMNRHWGSEFPGPYKWAVRNHPHVPIMLAEWGVSERPARHGWKARFFERLPRQIRKVPHVKALVYFNHDDGRTSGDVRIDTSPRSRRAYSQMAVHLGN